MILHTSPLSPFVRKVLILIRIKGLQDEITEQIATQDGANGYANHANPLGKIPALEREGQETLFDSPVICEYLDSLSDPLLPASGEARFKQLRLHALGDGLAEAVYNYRYESVRPDALHWAYMIERHNTALRNVIDWLEANVDDLGSPWEYGNLAIICALSYMDFRAGHVEWRDRAPNLANWMGRFEADPIYQETHGYSD